MFTSLSYKITHYFIDWIHIYQGQDKLSKFLGAIIMSHIYFNENGLHRTINFIKKVVTNKNHNQILKLY